MNKNILNPSHFERFLNFLIRDSSREVWYVLLVLLSKCAKYVHLDITLAINSNYIDFEKLRNLKIKSIGIFGSREEVLDILLGFSAISTAMVNTLKSDGDDNSWLSCGIHTILPMNLQQCGHRWDEVAYVFYWPMTTSFDTKRTMKAVKYMRKVCFVLF